MHQVSVIYLQFQFCGRTQHTLSFCRHEERHAHSLSGQRPSSSQCQKQFAVRLLSELADTHWLTNTVSRSRMVLPGVCFLPDSPSPCRCQNHAQRCPPLTRPTSLHPYTPPPARPRSSWPLAPKSAPGFWDVLPCQRPGTITILLFILSPRVLLATLHHLHPQPWPQPARRPTL